MLIWLVAAVLFFIVEAAVPGLVSVWFGMAAVVTMLVSPFVKNFLYEFYIFIILSGILFFFTRKIAKSWKEKRKDKLDRIRGTVVEVKSINDKGLCMRFILTEKTGQEKAVTLLRSVKKFK